MPCIHTAHGCLAQYAQRMNNTSETYGYIIIHPPSTTVHVSVVTKLPLHACIHYFQVRIQAVAEWTHEWKAFSNQIVAVPQTPFKLYACTHFCRFWSCPSNTIWKLIRYFDVGNGSFSEKESLFEQSKYKLNPAQSGCPRGLARHPSVVKQTVWNILAEHHLTWCR